MESKTGLVPTPITDKNGKQTTVYVKSSGPGSSSGERLPAPVLSQPRNPRFIHQRSVLDVVDSIDTEKYKYLKPVHLKAKALRATSEDLKVLAQTMDVHPEFKEFFLAAAEKHIEWNNIVSIAAVYDPQLPQSTSITRRIFMLQNALEHAHKHIHGDLPDGGWSLASENEYIQAKAKRFVAAWCTVDAAGGVAGYDILMRVLDNSRTDHDETLKVLRSSPYATVEQIDFILSGGPSSLSTGAL